MPFDLMNRSSLKRSHHHLKQLVETVVADEFNLRARGLSFFVDELNVSGSPPERLKLWATLHFLPLGSPFCCPEPACHVPLFGKYLDRVNDALRSRMGIRQPVSVEFSVNSNTTHEGVEFDNVFSGRCPSTDLSNIDQKDALGRTALMRAAIRGHGHWVEELLAAGADPATVDNQGRGIIEQMRKSQTWTITMLEEALAKRTSRRK
jgi:hypothetical protein